MNPFMNSDVDFRTPEPETDDPDATQDAPTITTSEVSDTQEEKILATDHDAIKKKLFQPDPDLETIDEVVHDFHITNWKSLDDKVYGPIFECGGIPFRIMMFPFGNKTNGELASFYLEQAHQEKPPEDWYACVQFLFVLSNTKEPSIYYTNTVAHHRFHTDANDWGYTRFIELRKAMQTAWDNDGRPLIEDEAATMTVYVRVVKDPTGVLWHDFVNYDSKKETGMVGLTNQGATCYLNSLLQSLYLTNAFRKAIYSIPTNSDDDPRTNSAYALQRLFYSLQTAHHTIDTKELTEAFGWDSKQIFLQRDVQELERVLLESMEKKMKDTPHEKDLPNVFAGSFQNYVKCINVDYESLRSQDFWDIPLNVRGCANLDESFKADLQVEKLEGDNQYSAEGHGLQDAMIGSVFKAFPPVLHLQLKRFEFNFELMTTTKINDRHEFPEVFDASPYLADDVDRSEPYIYHLHGVLVQSGELESGHYYAFLKPHKNGHFYRFDDDKVTRATKKEAIDDNFGGDFGAQPNGVTTAQRNPYTWKWSKQRLMNAYMLVYIRESRLDEILHPISDEDVPPHVGAKLEEERIQAERLEKDRREAPLYMQVSVATTANFNANTTFDVFPYTVHAGTATEAFPRPYRLLKATQMTDFRKMMAEELEIDEELIRLWPCVGRQNNTIRPDLPLPWSDASLVEVAQKAGGKTPFRIWLETTTRDSEGEPDWADYDAVTNLKNPTKPILLFLKYFDVENQSLRGHGTVYIEKHRRITELGPIIMQRMGWPEATNIKLFEEIKMMMIEPLRINISFHQAELQDGDIICFQKQLPEPEIQALADAGRCTDAPQYYSYLVNRVNMHFAERNNLDDPDRQFELELSRKMTYDQVAAKVGEHLKVDPTHLRFSTIFAATGKPRPPIRRTLNQTLNSMMSVNVAAYGQNPIKPDRLLYEVLELSLSELELKKSVKISLLSEGITREDTYDILVAKNGVVRDFIEPLKRKANISDEAEKTLRFYEVHGCKIYRELTEDCSVVAFNEFVSLYAEQIPQEEIDADPDEDRAVYCFHFDREPNKVHDIPFKFIVKPGELFKDTKERLSKRTGIKDKQFDKIKFAVVSRASFSKPEYLQDDDILSEKLAISEDQLGLDHTNKTRNILSRNDTMMIR